MTTTGFTLRPTNLTPTPGPSQPIEFVITGPDAAVVTGYDVHHDRQLHLIAARSDASGYQHVHPTLTEDGSWRATLDLVPGHWRLFADVKPRGAEAVTVTADLIVPGEQEATSERHPTRISRVGEYTVTLAGDLVPGRHSMLVVTVTLNGKPVIDLEPYLGAYGHLVVLYPGDADDALSYLHVHPQDPAEGDFTSGPDVAFHAGVDTDGLYHAFFDFKHHDAVRTAEFRIHASS